MFSSGVQGVQYIQGEHGPLKPSPFLPGSHVQCKCKCKRKKIHVWTTSLHMQTQTQAPTQEVEKVSFSSAAFAVHTCEPRQHKRKSKKRKKKQFPSIRRIGSMPRHSEVISSSIFQQSGISLNLRTGPTGHVTLFNQWEGALVFINKQIKTSPQWSKIFKTADGVGQN